MSSNPLIEELKSMRRFELTAFCLGESSTSFKQIEDGPVKTYLFDYLNTVKDTFENFGEESPKIIDSVMVELQKLSTKLDNSRPEFFLCNSLISACCTILTNNEEHLVEYAISSANNCAEIKIHKLQGIIIRDNINRAIAIKEHWREK